MTSHGRAGGAGVFKSVSRLLGLLEYYGWEREKMSSVLDMVILKK